MKYCEKCGNKLEEGFAFCDKCGAKVGKGTSKKHEEHEEKETKKEKIKEEKVKEEKIKEEVKEEVVEDKPLPPVPPRPPRPPKSGKGKFVFLWILVLLLLASTVTFLVLWLTKPTESNNSNYNKKDNTETVDPEPKKDNKYVGKWEQNVEYKSGTKVTQRTYGLIELKEDGTFESLFYDKDNMSKTKEEIDGTYKISGNKVTFTYKLDGEKETKTFTIKNDKMCIDADCDDYLVKDGNNKITIYNDDDDDDKVEIKKITYTEYQNLQKNYKDAIVVVIQDGCSWCEKYESVVEKIADYYKTPVYYYESDGKISISGTPTTIIIKNGYIVDSIEGYKDYSVVADKLDELGVK